MQHLVLDIETVADKELIAELYYPDISSVDEAFLKFCQEEAKKQDKPIAEIFVPSTLQMPISIVCFRLDSKYSLDTIWIISRSEHSRQRMAEIFWAGINKLYSQDQNLKYIHFNGRGFDLPILEHEAFKYSLSCEPYFGDTRYGPRDRYGNSTLDLMDWFTSKGSYRLTGGLNLLSKKIGLPGKIDTNGQMVSDLYDQGKLKEIDAYCLCDVVQTYFVFLRMLVIQGQITSQKENNLREDAIEKILADKISNQIEIKKFVDLLTSNQNLNG